MKLPNFSFEKRLWEKGYRFVAGIDEVGRGCFAGPVVASCVAFDSKTRLEILKSKIRIDDSKKLSGKQREKAYFWIRKNAAFYGIGKASVSQINRLGIKKATEIAFRKAVKNCRRSPNYLLIDAFFIPYVKGLKRKNQLPMVHGDAKSVSIAAASIVAKVHRDRLMVGLSKKYKYYGWERNKGYGTTMHQVAIKKFGLTKVHRVQFVETWKKNGKRFNDMDLRQVA